jgi:hypothetical protein
MRDRQTAAGQVCPGRAARLSAHASYATKFNQPGSASLSDDGYIIEFHQVGAYVKVSVMDPVSLTEVSMVTPASMPQGQAAQAAIRKLKYVMARRNGTVADGSAGGRK